MSREPVGWEVVIAEFIGRARDYCEWVEGGAEAPHVDLLKASQHVSALSAAALHLPDVDHDAIGDYEAMSGFDMATVKPLMKQFVGFPFQYYWEVFNPSNEEPPVCGDIVDDFLDIYRDIKEGLLTLENGNQPLAVWYWRMTFGIHWGRHAVSALKALHQYESQD